MKELKWRKHAKDLLVIGAEKSPCMIGKDDTASICFNGYYINIKDLFENLPKEE